MGTEGTSGTAPGATTTLSTTFASTSFATDDYEIVSVIGRGGAGAGSQTVDENVDPFPNVDDVNLNALKITLIGSCPVACAP
nr:hypothetical protein [Tanacetum cinerariifolium]